MQAALRVHRLHHLLERHLLVPIRSQRHLPHPPQHLLDARPPPQLRPQHQLIDEETHQPLHLHPIPVRHVRPDHRLLAAAVAPHQLLEHPGHRHEQRHPLPPALPLQPFRQLRPQRVAHAPATVALHRRTRAVRRHRPQRCRPRELPPPVVELRLQRLPTQPLPLPHRVVGVLHPQLLQRALLAPTVRLVQPRHLADHHPHTPAVRHDVVQHHHQHPLALERLQMQREDDEYAEYREAARDLYLRFGKIEIDDAAVVSVSGDGGAYVSAWVYVSEEGLGSTEDPDGSLD